ncbi:DUF5804 family protein [Halobacterium sp. KA-6]|jgi:hypothetical protein|uniref:DUF5804 family protein n=1 Tax=Halobacterium sp. KA-6 TaxID=2896368 RepID=UPI001E603F6E|nr:DUF5804 family protein [Halobacterium sp. KA-6]MCD2203469.1 DUF5804 family protein [Halobacterium sp. KA-6]
MTRVCIVGSDDVDLRTDLFAYETARRALATYDIRSPYENTVAVDTVSLGAAVSLLNDLNWYLVRLAEEAFVLEPSVADDEWLSRDLAAEVRDGDVRAPETDARLKVYGVEDGRLVEPMYVTRVQGERPEYDLRDVDETVVVRVTEDEFEA